MPMVYQQKSENSLDNTLKNDFIVLIINSTKIYNSGIKANNAPTGPWQKNMSK